MELSTRFLTGCAFACGLSGWFSIMPASASAFTDYSTQISGPSITFKWPQGSLIFPEDNNPNKTDEVFLLIESSTSRTELLALHQHLGLQFFSRKKYNLAKAEYLKVLDFKSSIPVVHKNLGVIYFNSKNYKQAEIAYRKALELNPRYTSALAKLALSLAAQRKYTSAERKFKQAIQAEPTNADHHLNLGHFYYYLKKDYRRAQTSYKKALKLNSRSVKAKINLRDIELKFRKSKDRESDFENSWGSDFDYDSLKNREDSLNIPSYPEEADIAGSLDEESIQPPLF